MISIIICHRNESLLQSLKKNIEETIGLPFELIIIDNRNNNYTILSAYNEGVRKSKYDIACFAHEDILFHTNNWGQKVVEHFNNVEVGMIGIIGGMAQSMIPSAWWFNSYFSKSARNLLLKDRNKKDKNLYHYYSNPLSDEGKTEVVILDGLWFCIRKKLFEKISFDEKTFSGFHLYDADISMQICQYAKSYVVYDILIEHKWDGNISQDFYKDLIHFTKKWDKQLPIRNSKIDSNYFKNYNWHALRNLILEMQVANISKEEIRQVRKQYYPVARQEFDSLWFRNYFFVSDLIGYKFANSLFYRIEKAFGFCKLPDHIKTIYEEAA